MTSVSNNSKSSLTPEPQPQIPSSLAPFSPQILGSSVPGSFGNNPPLNSAFGAQDGIQSGQLSTVAEVPSVSDTKSLLPDVLRLFAAFDFDTTNLMLFSDRGLESVLNSYEKDESARFVLLNRLSKLKLSLQ
jgi:hypothetical protein